MISSALKGKNFGQVSLVMLELDGEDATCKIMIPMDMNNLARIYGFF